MKHPLLVCAVLTLAFAVPSYAGGKKKQAASSEQSENTEAAAPKTRSVASQSSRSRQSSAGGGGGRVQSRPQKKQTSDAGQEQVEVKKPKKR